MSVPAKDGEDVASLSMETITLSDGYATFYRNDVPVGTVKLPRLMTDCINPEAVELGQVGLPRPGIGAETAQVTEAARRRRILRSRR